MSFWFFNFATTLNPPLLTVPREEKTAANLREALRIRLSILQVAGCHP